MDNLSTKKVKRPKTQKKKPKPETDFFTLLCKSKLKVTCVKEYRFHPIRKWRFDYAFPEYKVALEVEGGIWTGGRHVNPKGFLGDVEKYNTATLMGWRVYRTTPKDLRSLATLKMLESAIFGYNPALMSEKE
jgi:very-short-patch-repair endonuclease